MSNDHVSPSAEKKNNQEDWHLFNDLFHAHYRTLVIYAYRYVNDWQAAEDIIQDVFLALWVHINEINPALSVKSFLYRSTYNKSLNYLDLALNKRKTERENNIDFLIHTEVMSCNQLDTLIMKEMEEEIDKVIAAFPEQREKVYKMSRQDGLRNREIATELGISEKAVEKHMTKALKDIREYLSQSDHFPLWILLILLRNL